MTKEIDALRNLFLAAKRFHMTSAADDEFIEVVNTLYGEIIKAEPLLNTDPEYNRLILCLNELARQQFDWVESQGWHNKTTLEALALIASEVGEAVNECRGNQPTEKLAEELADVILRTLDLAVWLCIDIEDAISKKMAINEIRGTRGRKV